MRSGLAAAALVSLLASAAVARTGALIDTRTGALIDTRTGALIDTRTGASIDTPTDTRTVAPGAPGIPGAWAPAGKTGFGTSRTLSSRVWFTLGPAGPTEIYYPRPDTPDIRDLQLVVTDGRSFVDRQATDTITTTVLADPRALVFRQRSVARSGHYVIDAQYATDPHRSAMLVRLRVSSRDRTPLRVYALLNPAPDDDRTHTTGRTSGTVLLATGGAVATAFAASPAFTRTSNGFLGTSDGGADLLAHRRLTGHYATAIAGDVVQTAQLPIDGVRRRLVTLAIGFGSRPAPALAAARSSLAVGFSRIAAAYAAGWHAYLAGLPPPPAGLAPHERALYLCSVMLLAAAEDKLNRGAFVASPTAPWFTGTQQPAEGYHIVWSRDLYQIATALIAAGDLPAARRASRFLFERQQRPDGGFPQNSRTDGTPVATARQLDEDALPIVLAWQLRRFDRSFFLHHVRPAADDILAHGPRTGEERWEEQDGWSPSTIAAEIAGLVCAADIARRNGDRAAVRRFLGAADRWQANVERWTVSANGPLSAAPYYLRLSRDARPDRPTAYDLGNGGPRLDQRAVADAGFLELVRLGVKPADDPVVVNSLRVVDATIATATAAGRIYWHRYTGDGYGETRDDGPWVPDHIVGSGETLGRLWPILDGERGEYDLLLGDRAGAAKRLADMDAASTGSLLLPEQVWDDQPPAGAPAPGPASGPTPGRPTASATPLEWSQAQFVRLARSIAAGRPVEQPAIVACRYTGRCGD